MSEPEEINPPCFCGVENPHYDDDVFEGDCDGMGNRECHCGGDLCVCHNHGAVECGGCDACAEQGEDPDYDGGGDDDSDERDLDASFEAIDRGDCGSCLGDCGCVSCGGDGEDPDGGMCDDCEGSGECSDCDGKGTREAQKARQEIDDLPNEETPPEEA